MHHGLGSENEWSLSPKFVGGPACFVVNQHPGDVGSVSSLETLSSRPERPACACSHRHISGLLHQPPGVSVCAPCTDPSVGQSETFLLRSVYIPGISVRV